jgi:hypothetical protein
VHLLKVLKARVDRLASLPAVITSNGNASKMKANKSFDNGVFFNIKAK